MYRRIVFYKRIFLSNFKTLRTLLSVVKMFVSTLHNNSGELLDSHVFLQVSCVMQNKTRMGVARERK